MDSGHQQAAHIGTYALPRLRAQAAHIAGYALPESDASGFHSRQMTRAGLTAGSKRRQTLSRDAQSAQMRYPRHGWSERFRGLCFLVPVPTYVGIAGLALPDAEKAWASYEGGCWSRYVGAPNTTREIPRRCSCPDCSSVGTFLHHLLERRCARTRERTRRSKRPVGQYLFSRIGGNNSRV
jgi:hypothetical protein